MKNKIVHVKRIKENKVVIKSINISVMPNVCESESIEINITHRAVRPIVISGTETGEYLICLFVKLAGNVSRI